MVTLDAVHLIKATRHALVECSSVREILAEAWQAQALVEAVGRHLAESGPQLVRPEAMALSEVGGRACRSPEHLGPSPGAARAARLTDVQDPRCVLVDLAGLLVEAGVALVLVAVTADQQGLYWHVLEAIDAMDESEDRVTAMLRRLAVHEHGGAA
ncbi:hypothetical protein GCM10012287_43930 [Streptomyces daqingensis]|uniref:Uncharacterized protein n=1 Tax=Streptomyces daqingensis TaxID=1472640 RepID=A0ABQ2MMW8_9ACTN|nr:hypothetical protein GCM10012287_43930 [Streptomyces daqingensis]